MRGRGWRGAGLTGVMLLIILGRDEGAAGAAPTAGVHRCSRAVIEGEARAGQAFRRGFGGGLELVLEPIASGWVVRVLAEEGNRPALDYAGIATPPYRSISPLLLSTDFSFRAQDAVGWNPRRFRYAADARAFASMEAVYGRLAGGKTAAASDEEALARLASVQPEGVLEVMDAGLVPGTADQTTAAGLVATHFGTTAHRIEQPGDGRPTAVGKIMWVRFRARLEMRPGVRHLRGVKIESSMCGSG